MHRGHVSSCKATLTPSYVSLRQLKLLDHSLSTLRAGAYRCLKCLASAAIASVDDCSLAQRTVNVILPRLFSGIRDETDDAVRCTAARVLWLVSTACYKSSAGAAVDAVRPLAASAVVAEDLARDFFHCIVSALEASAARSVDIIAALPTDPDAIDEDAERFKEALKPEEILSCYLFDAASSVVKQHGAAVMLLAGDILSEKGRGCLTHCLSNFQLLASLAAPYILRSMSDIDPCQSRRRRSAFVVGILLIEHASPAAHSLLPAMLSAVVDALTASTATDIQQVATYGAGIVAQYGGIAVAPHAAKIVESLLAFCAAPAARTGVAEDVFENAIASLVRLAVYLPLALGIGVSSIFSRVVACLPLQKSATQARFVHGLVVDAFEKGAPTMLRWVSSVSLTRAFDFPVDEAWLGKELSQLSLVVRGIAAGLVLHHKRSDDAADEGTDEEGEDSDVALFSPATLVTLRNILVGTKASPTLAPALASIMEGLPPGLQVALRRYGA